MFPLFDTGVVDTTGKVVTGVVDIGVAPSLANISKNFWKKFEMTNKLFSEAWEKTIHEKNPKQKSCDTVCLGVCCHMLNICWRYTKKIVRETDCESKRELYL